MYIVYVFFYFYFFKGFSRNFVKEMLRYNMMGEFRLYNYCNFLSLVMHFCILQEVV